MSGQVLGSGIHFDAGNDSRIGEDFDKGRAVFLLLADGLVEENRAADALAETGRGHNQLPIGAPGIHGLWNAQLCESLVAGGIAFIHRQQPFGAGDQCLRSVR